MEKQQGFGMGALQPVDQKRINFMGAELLAIKGEDEKVFAAVNWICKGLGMTKGQKDAQVQKIQSDVILSRGCLKFQAGVIDPNNEVLAIELDYLPLWLAKISITPKMQEENPGLADNLIDYQLKARDALAQAFLNKPKLPTSPTEIAILTLEGLKEQSGRLGTIEKRMDDYEMNAPILPQQAESLTDHIKRKVYAIVNANFGGNSQIKTKLFASIGKDIKRAFAVNRRAMIAKKDFEKAVDFIRGWEPDSVTRYQLQLEFTDDEISKRHEGH